eukprot:TRINITY_DN85892_c0_g1_i1.p1 TRINITY_DN85892_c0_g1~~TRINITY_DN85892_c0_g1_i1.p1  ORF type:complete len:422 (-),score=25.71 TRINITY_DN85892_c0_g1_i1:287-1552(-)
MRTLFASVLLIVILCILTFLVVSVFVVNQDNTESELAALPEPQQVSVEQTKSDTTLHSASPEVSRVPVATPEPQPSPSPPLPSLPTPQPPPPIQSPPPPPRALTRLERREARTQARGATAQNKALKNRAKKKTILGTEIPTTDVDPTPPGCPKRYLTFVNDFGSHNNQLITLLNALAVTRDMGYTIVLPPFIDFERRRPHKPTKIYDFTLFRQAGYCFVTELNTTIMGHPRKHAAYKLFRTLPANMSRPYHLLRPSELVEGEVRKWLPKLPLNFTAVHRRSDLRDMYMCKVPEEEKPGFCHMRLDYIRQVQREVNKTDELFFLGTDHPELKLSARYVRYTGLYTKSRIISAVIDFFIMTKAGVFLGNPASSLAMNVCNIRRSQNPPLPCYNFTFCYDRPPFVVGWPCGSPMPGISFSLEKE